MKITARLSRGERWWVVYVPEVDHHTQGRSIREAKDMAVDLAATVLDVPIDEIELGDVTIELPARVRELLNSAESLRAEAEAANSAAAADVRRAARTLRDVGMTARDIGEALGVSHQRAQQLYSTV